MDIDMLARTCFFFLVFFYQSDDSARLQTAQEVQKCGLDLMSELQIRIVCCLMNDSKEWIKKRG